MIAQVKIVTELEATLEQELAQGLSVPPSIRTLLDSEDTVYLD